MWGLRLELFLQFLAKFNLQTYTKNCLQFTVKVARAKLPAMAAGILLHRQNYPRMQAKISAGNDCLQFPQVTGGNLPAPAGNLGEAFIVRVRPDFLKPRDVSF